MGSYFCKYGENMVSKESKNSLSESEFNKFKPRLKYA